MNIVIIGTGNAAVILGKTFVSVGHEIKQVYGRNQKNAETIAALFNTKSTHLTENIIDNADLYIIAVADRAIQEIAATLVNVSALVVHTSGSVSMHVLAGCKRYGVLYPLQSLRKEMNVLPEIPVFVDACNEDDVQLLQTFAVSFSNNVSIAHNEERMQLHIGAVLCSNFTNHLYALTQEFCEAHSLNFNNYLPLINETAQRLKYYKAKDVQTGPAVRNDKGTLDKHLKALGQFPQLERVYQFLSDSIMYTYSIKNPDGKPTGTL